MALVNGNYRTIGGSAIPANRVPRLDVRGVREASTRTGDLISALAEEITLATNGSWSKDLTPTTDVQDHDFHYLLRGFYFEPEGYGSGRGFRRHDVFEHKLYVPPEGGNVGVLLRAPRPRSTDVLVDPTISDTNPPPVLTPGFLYLSGGDDPNLGSGDLYEVVG